MTVRLKLHRTQILIITGYVFCIVSIIALPGALSTAISLLYMLVLIALGSRAAKRGNSKISTIIVLLPVVMSVAQNVYLGLGSPKLNPTYLQIHLSLHFLLFTGIVLLNMQTINRKAQWAIASIAIIVFQSALLYILYPAPFTSALSSVRNILSCMLLFCFGIIMNKRVNTEEYYKWITRISWFTVLFGLIEWFAGTKVWQALNITQLWELKQIPLSDWGIPPNWYSSERIAGQIIRRMVSSFADPVNLGTFLFAAFMIAWYRKQKILLCTLAICAIFTVSKGSLLGFLVFIVVYFWQKRKFRILVPIMAGATLVAGILFIRFSKTSSSGSVFAHVAGFTSAFSVLIKHPLGLGVGNVGVLAGLFNESLLNASVSETGIGMIIAQLGIVGIIVYIYFFTKLSLLPKRWGSDTSREKTLYYTLLFSFIANAMFNEVALSPNSCGLYFVEMAFIHSAIRSDQNHLC